MLTACDPLQPQYVVGPYGLLPLQRPYPGPWACLRLRLGPRLGFRLQLRFRPGLHARAQGPGSRLRPRSGPVAALLHLHGLAGPQLACCRRGCWRRLEPREEGESAAPPLAGAPGTVPPPGRARDWPRPQVRAPRTRTVSPGLGRGRQWASFIFFIAAFRSWQPPPYSLCPGHSPSVEFLPRGLAWDALLPQGLLSWLSSKALPSHAI